MKFYTGFVEDIKDPLKIGRMRVRVKGVHSDSKVQNPTADLPWAAPLHPLTSAAYQGIGFGGCACVIGTQVELYFRDEGQFQQPVIFGTVPGLQAGDEASTIKPGFESDFGRLATNNVIDKTLVKTKTDQVQIVESEPVAFTEPVTPYNAEYGLNHTTTSKSGHVVELDDTVGAERIHIWHKSGTFIEVHPDGTTVVRTEGDSYEISKKNVNIYTEIDKQEFIGANQKEHIGGNITINVIGNEDIHIGGNSVIKIDGNSDVTIGGNSNVKVSGNAKLDVGGTYDVNVGGSATLTCGGTYTVKAATINLN